MAATRFTHPTFTPRTETFTEWCATGRHNFTKDGWLGQRNHPSTCPACFRRFFQWNVPDQLEIGGARTYFNSSPLPPVPLGP